MNRVFFSNTSFLPNQTPIGLEKLRKEELVSLRGDGHGERKEWERIYDYDYYNDIGHNIVFGGSLAFPYPRRGRTGRPHNQIDYFTESRPDAINLEIYVPPDERCSPKKLLELMSNSIQAIVHFLVPEAKSLLHQDSSVFTSFDDIRNMFSSNNNQVVEDCLAEKLMKIVSNKLFKKISHATKNDPMKFPLPQIIAENEFAWKDDQEFGRQMLAGTNPVLIKCLEAFPPRNKNGGLSSIKESHIQHNLDGLTLPQAMSERRILILDHHDYLMPFLHRIIKNDVCAYASRTLLFLKNDETLKPVAIELSLPSSSSNGEEINRVFVPASQGIEAALWQLAKAHVSSNDSCYHQLISHWLHTHAVIEPFIIATRRHLSVMHPIHQLLNPHFKDTMHINALCRSILINSGGILEKTLLSGEISMEISSMLYKQWRFDEQGLPTDLLKRGMAIKDPQDPSRAHLLFQDYPYAADGLEIWGALKTWVTDFCTNFYPDNNSITSDIEIQSWWTEIRTIGHGDKSNEHWWYEIKTLSDLIETLTNLIWISSALHASINFGQYGYASYAPNRPTICRKFIPYEGTFEFAEFLKDPDMFFIQMLPKRFEMTLGLALTEVVSQHTDDEVYLGQNVSTHWIDNEEIQKKFEKFNRNLREIEKKIIERNRDLKMKNRWGSAKIPYQLMYPNTSNVGSSKGITGKGIPNSIAI